MGLEICFRQNRGVFFVRVKAAKRLQEGLFLYNRLIFNELWKFLIVGVFSAKVGAGGFCAILRGLF